MIDTHCHLTDRRLGHDLAGVLARARAAGVKRIVTIGCTPDDSSASLAVADAVGHDMVRVAVGIHPNYSADFVAGDVERLRPLAAHPAVVAIGEMGLDNHHHRAPKAHQAEIFVRQLALAGELGNRPVVVHCREAIDEALAILRDFPAIRAVFHCFTGTPAEARRIIDAGYTISFTGIVSYKSAAGLREVAGFVPADQYMVETDGPYLPPEPHKRSAHCEPAMVMDTARCIAAARGQSLESVDAQTTANAARFFGW